jgi:hypothetical protein
MKGEADMKREAEIKRGVAKGGKAKVGGWVWRRMASTRTL